MYRISSAHEEGGERLFAVSTQRFNGDENGHVRVARPHRGRDATTASSSRSRAPSGEIPADLVLLAMGFTGPEPTGLLEVLGVELDNRGNVVRSSAWETTQPGVFVCGDAGRGQSLIVWAIAEGRACAAAVDEALMGSSLLPAPITPTMR